MLTRAAAVVCALGACTAVAPAAQASVLIHSLSPLTKRCGAVIKTGVWHRDDGAERGRTVSISIRTLTGKTVWSKRVTARDTWRYFTYRPRCGRSYVVRYVVEGGVDESRVRIRA